MMRDPRFPFESDTILITIAVARLYNEWSDLVDQKSPDRFTKFYEEIIDMIEKMVKNEMIDPTKKGVRKLEEIIDASK